MNRLLIAALVAACAVLAVPVIAGASHSNGGGPKFEKAEGTGTNSYGQVHVNANEKGDPPFGHFVIADPFSGGEFEGEITCLTTNGNRAWMYGTTTDGDGPPSVFIFIEDNGEGSDSEDRMSWRPGTPPDQGCPQDPVLGTLAEPLERGNYLVHTPQQ